MPTDMSPSRARRIPPAIVTGTMHSDSAGFQVSTVSSSIRNSRFKPPPFAPSKCFDGKTCLARCCPTNREHRQSRIGIPRRNWKWCASVRRIIATSRSRLCQDRSSIFWRAIQPRRVSTERRIATGGAITTKSVCGRITSAMRATFTTTLATAAGLSTPQRFLIAGDLNADPLDGDSFQNAIGQLLTHPAVNAAYFPSSPGGPEQARKGGANNSHRGDPAFDTADFNDFNVGNLHVDYLLPSRQGLSILGGGVFWPLESDATFPLIAASDHRLVWLDLVLTPIITEAVRELRAVRETNDIVLQWKTQSGVIYTVQTRNDLGGWSDALQMPVSIDPAAQFARAVDRDASQQLCATLPGGGRVRRLRRPGRPVACEKCRSRSPAARETECDTSRPCVAVLSRTPKVFPAGRRLRRQRALPHLRRITASSCGVALWFAHRRPAANKLRVYGFS